MGHLTRQLAILRWIRRYADVLGQPVECWLLTSSEADTLARIEGIPALKIPSKSMLRDAGLAPHRLLAVARSWVLSAVTTLQPDLLIVDTFPAGSFGELAAVLELARVRALVAREVRPEVRDDPSWQALLPLYERVIVPGEGWEGAIGPILLRERAELLPRARARAALGIPDAARACWISVGGGGDGQAGRILPRLVDDVRARGWHPIVAAGPLYRGEERRGPGVTWLERYASAELMCAADAAISAAGYNSTWELMLAGIPTVFLPRPRLGDDQRARAERVVAQGMGIIAPRLEDAAACLAQLPLYHWTSGDTQPLPPAEPPPLPTGAREAAASVLSLLLDARDVARARAAWSDATLTALAGTGLAGAGSAGTGPTGLDGASVVDLLRLFGGDLPSTVARRRAGAAEVDERGGADVVWSPAPLAPFLALCGRVGVTPARALPVTQRLRQLFPASDPAALLDACEALWPAVAPWDDWEGLHAVLRALPVQREWRIGAFARRLGAWAAAFDDPYDLLRALHTGTARGAPLAEVLALDPTPA